MAQISKSELTCLYQTQDINDIWNSSQNCSVIKHPEWGLISSNALRAKYHLKPCPYCGKKMVHGKNLYSTQSKQDAIKRNYEYINRMGQKIINQAGSNFFYPNYVTIDHKLNKARFPEKMFDYSNLQVICWKCNSDKGDDNAYDIQVNLDFTNDLVSQALDSYQPL